MKIIKKYSNRRLYDTDQSQYVTLEELAALIREGHDVKVIDASTEEDLTQAILARIVVESREAARLLPVPLLMQMIRMEEDALAEFMGLYMGWALDVYFQVKRGLREFSPYQIFGGQGSFPFRPGQAWGRLFGDQAPWKKGGGAAPKVRQKPPVAPDPVDEPPEDAEENQGGSAPDEESSQLAALQAQIEALNARLDDLSGDEDEE